MPDTFDFIVIGGGMMGAPCARHLAEAGHSVALVAAPEPEETAGSAGPFGSHFDAARITRRVAADPDWSLLSHRSIDRYRDLGARSGETIFRETGALMAGPQDGPLAAFTEGFRRVAAGLPDPPEILCTAAIWEETGLALPEDAEACLERRKAGWIDPRAMRRAQQRLARQAGAIVVPQAATRLEAGTVRLADGSTLSAGHVVVATGPHAASDGLLPQRPKVRVWARTVAFARLSEAEARRLAAMPSVIWVPEGWDHDLYLLPPVRYPDGRVYLKIGGQLDGPRIASEAEMRAWFHGGGEPEVGERLLRELRALIPDLAIEASHTGPCAVVWTETGLPYIDAAGPGVTVLCGGNGAAAKSGDEIGRLGALKAAGAPLTGEGYTCSFGAVWA